MPPSHGYELHRGVSCSGDRIDLAVLDPDEPSRYLLGIECYGTTCRKRRHRDREKLRYTILDGMSGLPHHLLRLMWPYGAVLIRRTVIFQFTSN